MPVKPTRRTFHPGPAAAVAVLLALIVSPPTRVHAEKANVLLITVDTFRPDFLGAHGYPRDTSPALDRLAADGVLFEWAMSSSSWTSPGLLSVQTGQFAPTHGVDVRGKSLAPGTPTFATELRKAGYAVPDILYLSSIPNLKNLGLTRSYADRDRYLPEDDEILFRALEAYRDSSFFLYYHYRNLHLPLDPSPAYESRYVKPGFKDGFLKERVDFVQSNVTVPVGSVTLAPGDSSWVRGLYAAQVREMDDVLFARLRRTLEDLDLVDKTIVIVTADHGEELLEHGWIGHPSTSFKGSAFDELLHIPLIVTAPGLLPQGVRVRRQVQNVDILPTILDLLGLPIPDTVQGRSLLGLVRGEEPAERLAFTETTPGGYQATPEMMKTRIRAARSPSWKLIHTHGPGEDRYELYDLVNDPDERREVSAEYPDTLAAYRAALHAWTLESQRARVAFTAGQPEASMSAKAAAHVGPLEVLFPSSGDTLRFAEDGMTVRVRWKGQEDAAYVVEYDVGEGSYHLAGEMAESGTSAEHGPFTEEMWNMLALYNPFSFRIRSAGDEAIASAWVRFTIAPTRAAAPPTWGMMAIAAAAFAWSEAAILAGGLADLSVAGLARAASVPVNDVVSWCLIAAIAGALVHPGIVRLGVDRARAWGLALGYTLCIYASLSIMPTLWGTLYRATRGRIDYGGGMVVAVAGAAVVAFLVRRCRRPGPALAVVAIGAAYVWLLLNLGTSPAERFHLAEYGLLAFLLFRALRLDLDVVPSYGLAFVLGSALGVIDETLQWILPERVFEWKDIGLNAASVGLAVALIAALRSASGRASR